MTSECTIKPLDRLRELMEISGCNQSRFAERLGVDQSSFSKVVKGNRPFGKNMQRRVASEFGVSLDWLTNGNGEMFIDESKTSFLGQAQKATSEDLVNVKFFDITPTASFIDFEGCATDNFDTIGVTPLRNERIDKNYCVFEIHGDSMKPTILSHSRILCKLIPESHWQYAEGVVVIAYRDKVVLKRVKLNSLLIDSTMTLVSDNQEYGSEVVQQSDIHCIFKAKRIISQDIF